ncbi:exonuclease V-like [Littorina saxatilis]|uniref:Exonuclease V n=1 Tax=Littorina saxatilis TaxID=31220 RepID=A0AAN9AKW9_9CAEN
MANNENTAVIDNQNEDSWSDIDESLLVQCDDNENSDPSVINKETSHLKDPLKVEEEETPLEQFCKHGYLCVTDLTQQVWCEQHLCYTMMGMEPPLPSPLDQVPPPLPTADRPEVKAGKSVHLARELEVHNVVSVKISSRADKWGLHTLNLLSTIRGFLSGIRVAREVPIFGDPFGTGDLFFGIVDELRFDADSYSLGLVELKTRKTQRMPGKAQKKQHSLQVLIYKQLWDNLVRGNFSTDFFLKKLNLTASADQPLSEGVLQHIDSSGVPASSLRQLLTQLTTSVQALVCISSVEIEYVLQETGSVIGRTSVREDFDWLWRMFGHCMDFWHGRRGVEGVAIEEAWKCGGCEFSPVCEWRMKKSRVLSAQNRCSDKEL